MVSYPEFANFFNCLVIIYFWAGFNNKQGVGAMEIEYQANTTRTLTVTENTTPGAAPAGFKFADASSYRVALAEGSASITRQQIDYVFNLNSMLPQTQ